MNTLKTIATFSIIATTFYAVEVNAQSRVSVVGRGVSVRSNSRSGYNWGRRGYRYRYNRSGALVSVGVVPNSEVALSGGFYVPNVSAQVFNAESIRRSTNEFVRIQTTGNDLGFRTPLVMEMALHARFSFNEYFAIGAAAGFIAAGSYDSAPQDATIRAITSDRGGLWGLMVAPEVYAMIPVGPVTFRLGAMAGIRSYNVRAADLVSGDCTWVDNNGLTHNQYCSSTLSSVTFFAQPRAQVDLQLGRGLTLGAYGGVELFPLIGFSGGFSISIQTPGFGDRYAWSEPAEPVPEQVQPTTQPTVITQTTTVVAPRANVGRLGTGLGPGFAFR